MKCVVTGRKKFEDQMFKPPDPDINKMTLMNKTKGGGLWASPAKSEHSWINFCETEEFNIRGLDNKFYFYLKSGYNYFHINTAEEYRKIPKINKNGVLDFLDFSEIYENYDAIILTCDGERRTRFLPDGDIGLYGWDCNTVFIINPDCMKHNLKLGDVVTVESEFLNTTKGTPAVVYDEYTDTEGGQGVCIITVHGEDLGGFSKEESDQYLTFLYHSNVYYNFENVMQLGRDFSNGFFTACFINRDLLPDQEINVINNKLLLGRPVSN